MATLLIWKQSCRAATTGPITLSGLSTAIDGVTLVAMDRVLVQNQADQTKNGVYIASSTTWKRAADSTIDSSLSLQGLMTSGSTFWVREGTANKDSVFTLTTPDPIHLTDNLVFSALSTTAVPTLARVPPPFVSPQYDLSGTTLLAGVVADSSGKTATSLGYTDNTLAIGVAIQALVNAGGGELHFPYFGTGIYRMDGPFPVIDVGNANDNITLDFHGATIFVPTLANPWDTTANTNLPQFIIRIRNTSSTKRVIIRNLHLIGPDTQVTDPSYPEYAKNPSMYNSALIYGGIWLGQRCNLINVTVEGFAIGVSLAGDHCLIDQQCSLRNNTINLWYEKTTFQKDNIVQASYLSRARLASVGCHPWYDRITNDLHGSCHLGFAPFGVLRPKYGLPRGDGANTGAPAWSNTKTDYVIGDIVSYGTPTASLYISVVNQTTVNTPTPGVNSPWQQDTVAPIFFSAGSIFSNDQTNFENLGDNVQINDFLWILSTTPQPTRFQVGAPSGHTAVVGSHGFTLVSVTGTILASTQSNLPFAIQRFPGDGVLPSNYSQGEKEFVVNHSQADTTFENCGNAWIYDDTDASVIHWQGLDKPQFSGIDDNVQMPLSSVPNTPKTSANLGTLLTAGGGTPTFFASGANFGGESPDPTAAGDWLEILGINIQGTIGVSSAPGPFTFSVVTSQPHGLAVGDSVLLTSFTHGTQGTNGFFSANVLTVNDDVHFTATYGSATSATPTFTGSPVLVRQVAIPLAIGGSSSDSGQIQLALPQHAIEIGDVVIVGGHQASTGANGTWVVFARTSTTITLNSSVWTTNGSSGGFVYRRSAGTSAVAIASANGTGGPITISTAPTAHGLVGGQKVTIQGNPSSLVNGAQTVGSPTATTFTIGTSGSVSNSGPGTVFPTGESWFFESRARFFRIAAVTDPRHLQLEADPYANCSGLAYRVVRYPRLGLKAAQIYESAIHLGHGQSLYHAHEMLWTFRDAPQDLRVIFQSPENPINGSIWQTPGGLPPTIQVTNFSATTGQNLRSVALSGDRVFQLWRPTLDTPLQKGDLVAHRGGGSGWRVGLYSLPSDNPAGIVLMDGGPQGSVYPWVAVHGTLAEVRFPSAGSTLTEFVNADSTSGGGLVAATDPAATLRQQLGIRVGTPSPLTGFAPVYLTPPVALQQDRVMVGPWSQNSVSSGQSGFLVLLLGASNSQQEWAALRSGFISGISVVSSVVCTQGSATFIVTKNGTPTTLSAIINTTNVRTAIATLSTQLLAFSQGDRLGVVYNSSGAPTPFAPTGGSAVIFVEVVM